MYFETVFTKITIVLFTFMNTLSLVHYFISFWVKTISQEFLRSELYFYRSKKICVFAFPNIGFQILFLFVFLINLTKFSMNSPDRPQNIWDINIKSFNIVILSSSELFSKNCRKKSLYPPSDNASLNWKMGFREYFLKNFFFWKKLLIMFITPHDRCLNK